MATWLLDDLFHQRLPFLMFYPAVMAAAWYGGLGPGLLCAALAAAVEAMVWLEPLGSPMVWDFADALALTVFTGSLLVITLLSHSLHQSRDRIAAAARELRARARELARSNAELERFASVVAHDLRAPMMTISGHVHLLANDEALSVEGRGEVEAIQRGVRQIDALLTGLLEYSRVGRGGLKLTDCDVDAVLEKVLVTLRTSLDEAGAQVIQDRLPIVKADAVLLAQLLQNLIENAVKYHGGAAPNVHVSARRGPNEWIFSVADNGIGIGSEHFERIFHVFHRVHSDESQYSGTGIGLATCKKIVEQHGGRIWVESQLGRGSTFLFSIPTASDEQTGSQET